jgi:hypothetical protein
MLQQRNASGEDVNTGIPVVERYMVASFDYI